MHVAPLVAETDTCTRSESAPLLLVGLSVLLREQLRAQAQGVESKREQHRRVVLSHPSPVSLLFMWFVSTGGRPFSAPGPSWTSVAR